MENVEKNQALDHFEAVQEWAAVCGCREYLTPRAVERMAPGLSRRELVRRRMMHMPPDFERIAGCIMYADDEIEQFLFDHPQFRRHITSTPITNAAALTTAPRGSTAYPGERPLRCAIYARSATIDPNEYDPILRQTTSCAEEASRKGWTVVRTYSDIGKVGHSGNNGLTRLLHDAANNQFDVVVLASLDRISRDCTVIEWVVQRLRSHNVRLHCIDDEVTIKATRLGSVSSVNHHFQKKHCRKTRREYSSMTSSAVGQRLCVLSKSF